MIKNQNQRVNSMEDVVILDRTLAKGNCFFGHKWSKWTQTNMEKYVIRNDIQYPFIQPIQIKVCLRCNKMKTENIKQL
jgi:hypothetical protein